MEVAQSGLQIQLDSCNILLLYGNFTSFVDIYNSYFVPLSHSCDVTLVVLSLLSVLVFSDGCRSLQCAFMFSHVRFVLIIGLFFLWSQVFCHTHCFSLLLFCVTFLDRHERLLFCCTHFYI